MQQNRLNIVWLVTGLWLLSTAASADNVDAAKAAQKRALDVNAQVFAPDSWERAEKALEKAYKTGASSTQNTKIAEAYREADEDFDTAEFEAN